jgi:hypothetical protein
LFSEMKKKLFLLISSVKISDINCIDFGYSLF